MVKEISGTEGQAGISIDLKGIAREAWRKGEISWTELQEIAAFVNTGDVNRDGVINMDELNNYRRFSTGGYNFVSKLFASSCDELACDGLAVKKDESARPLVNTLALINTDPNKDGTITRDEAKNIRIGNAVLEAIEASSYGAFEYFKGFDINGDGIVDETGAGPISKEDLSYIGENYWFIHENYNGVLSIEDVLTKAYNDAMQETYKNVPPFKTELRELDGKKYIEVDWQSPSGEYGDPDVALTLDLRPILVYDTLRKSRDYQELLKRVGVEEVKKGNAYSYIDSDGNSIPQLEVFLRMQKQVFFWYNSSIKTVAEHAALSSVFDRINIVPLSTASVYKCAGPVSVSVYDRQTGKVREVIVSRLDETGAQCMGRPGFEDYMRVFQNLPPHGGPTS